MIKYVHTFLLTEWASLYQYINIANCITERMSVDFTFHRCDDAIAFQYLWWWFNKKSNIRNTSHCKHLILLIAELKMKNRFYRDVASFIFSILFNFIDSNRTEFQQNRNSKFHFAWFTRSIQHFLLSYCFIFYIIQQCYVYVLLVRMNKFLFHIFK